MGGPPPDLYESPPPPEIIENAPDLYQDDYTAPDLVGYEEEPEIYPQTTPHYDTPKVKKPPGKSPTTLEYIDNDFPVEIYDSEEYETILEKPIPSKNNRNK